MRRRFDIVPQHCLVGYFFYQVVLVQPQGYIFANIRHIESFWNSDSIPEQQMKLQLL